MVTLCLRDLVMDIGNVFDDFLIEKGIQIPSSLQEMEENNTSPEECGSALYGMDWAAVTEPIEDLIGGYLDRHNIPYSFEHCENDEEKM